MGPFFGSLAPAVSSKIMQERVEHERQRWLAARQKLGIFLMDAPESGLVVTAASPAAADFAAQPDAAWLSPGVSHKDRETFNRCAELLQPVPTGMLRTAKKNQAGNIPVYMSGMGVGIQKGQGEVGRGHPVSLWGGAILVGPCG